MLLTDKKRLGQSTSSNRLMRCGWEPLKRAIEGFIWAVYGELRHAQVTRITPVPLGYLYDIRLIPAKTTRKEVINGA